MNTTVKKIIFSLFITSLTLLLSACTKVENNTPEELEERFKIVTKTFMEPFENGELELYGKYSTKTIPSIEMVLESVFNADQRLLALKKPNYEKFEGGKLNDILTNHGFVAVSKDFYILVNNKGKNLEEINFYIDINGEKGPNKVGYDLFEFKLESDNKLIPVEYTSEALISKYYFSDICN